MITVSRTNPPPWVVTVGTDASEQNWPFATQADAEAAYRLAVASGQFTYQLRRATKTRPASAVTLVSLWRREDTTTIRGEPHVCYVGVDMPEIAEGKEQTNDD